MGRKQPPGPHGPSQPRLLHVEQNPRVVAAQAAVDEAREKLKEMSAMPVRRATMRVRAYPVLREAVEQGVAYGWRRTWKHRDDGPAEDVGDAAREEIANAVLGAICDAFDFPDDSSE